MRKFNFLFAVLLLAILPEMRSPAQPFDPNESFGHGLDPSRLDRVPRTDFIRREEMIPMRDGVKLYTIILVPSREDRMPIMLTRTPYGASLRSTPEQRASLRDILTGGDDIFADSGYIRVFQDVRGRNRSGGDYVMMWPDHVDHSTDTYDTIEWLLKNVDQNNGRVGMIGTSYDGFLVLMGMIHPHPALKAAVPLNPMVDGWKGDDWFHNGAFRQMTLDFLKLHLGPSVEGSDDRMRAGDDYSFYLNAVSAEGAAERIGIDRLPFWRTLVQHPAYDGFWQGQAMDVILGEMPLKVPTLYVHGLWDQEDIYGPIAAYEATESKDLENDSNFLVIGPWNHGGSTGSGRYLGPLGFKDATGYWFRHNVLLPFLNERLKTEAPKANTPPVLVYETGSDRWQSYDRWPLSCETGCRFPMRRLFLRDRFSLDFEQSDTEEKTYDAYVSDPADPVPYRDRPIEPVYDPASSWSLWLVDNQEMFSDRDDVLTYRTDILKKPVRISGLPIANLFAATSGADMDLVVKLIDEYPQSYPEQPAMSGYQLIISADILRGRYRKNPSNPSPVPPGDIEEYRWTLPAATHVFLPGHRIEIQIQSSWFPLYDRNPQTYVKNIFNAGAENYRAAVQRIYRSSEYASYIELPVVE
jgi:hypothetical protein